MLNKSSLLLSLFPIACLAQSLTVTLTNTTTHANMGTITFSDTKHGLLVKPQLQGLTPGLHGFHLHTNASCDEAGNAAGGHYDPANTGMHLGPYNDTGHLGDLPPLFATPDGSTFLPVLAPRLLVNDLHGHALIVHAGGDNFSDTPAALGGGGARVACASIETITTPPASPILITTPVTAPSQSDDIQGQTPNGSDSM